MSTSDVLQRTRAYIVDNFLYMRRDVQLAASDSLLGRGIIDSMGVMELVQFIEESFGVRVDDEDITEENLGSLDAIASFVTSKGSLATRAA
jgi:acyl carrier protein